MASQVSPIVIATSEEIIDVLYRWKAKKNNSWEVITKSTLAGKCPSQVDFL